MQRHLTHSSHTLREYQTTVLAKCKDHRHGLSRRRTFIQRRLRYSFTKCGAGAEGFHHSRLAAKPSPPTRQRLQVVVRRAVSDEELLACAWLRSISFYVYPPDRMFAGLLHQQNMAKEEFQALRTVRDDAQPDDPADDRATCLIAVSSSTSCPDAPAELILQSGDIVVGSLDLCNVKAVAGEVLIGDSTNVAYLANVCVAEAARRCRVGCTLLDHARDVAQQWGVDDLMVHIMAANKSALNFYERNGFDVIKMETPNQAHHRGRCLDGISGGGRTLLLSDSNLHCDKAS